MDGMAWMAWQGWHGKDGVQGWMVLMLRGQYSKGRMIMHCQWQLSLYSHISMSPCLTVPISHLPPLSHFPPASPTSSGTAGGPLFAAASSCILSLKSNSD